MLGGLSRLLLSTAKQLYVSRKQKRTLKRKTWQIQTWHSLGRDAYVTHILHKVLPGTSHPYGLPCAVSLDLKRKSSRVLFCYKKGNHLVIHTDFNQFIKDWSTCPFLCSQQNNPQCSSAIAQETNCSIPWLLSFAIYLHDQKNLAIFLKDQCENFNTWDELLARTCANVVTELHSNGTEMTVNLPPFQASHLCACSFAYSLPRAYQH